MVFLDSVSPPQKRCGKERERDREIDTERDTFLLYLNRIPKPFQKRKQTIIVTISMKQTASAVNFYKMVCSRSYSSPSITFSIHASIHQSSFLSPPSIILPLFGLNLGRSDATSVCMLVCDVEDVVCMCVCT